MLNYIGWLIVERLGTLAFKPQFDAYRKEVYGHRDLNSDPNTCAELAVQMAPNACTKYILQSVDQIKLAEAVVSSRNIVVPHCYSRKCHHLLNSEARKLGVSNKRGKS